MNTKTIAREPMFLNPVLRLKTYEAIDADGRKLGDVNDDNIHGAFRQARSQFGSRVRTVTLKVKK